MSDNLALWNGWEKPPASALKPIQAGRLKGKSDINPTWRMKALTEALGPCGVGWHYRITERWTQDCLDGEVMAFVGVELEICLGGEWSHPIPGIGGSKLVAKEAGGAHNNDEGWKMALTDALSVAMKALGVAAAVYEGRWDGSKYADEPAPAKPAPPPANTPPATASGADLGSLKPPCKVCGTDCVLRPAGVSKQGRPYDAFWSCPNRCKGGNWRAEDWTYELSLRKAEAETPPPSDNDIPF